MDTRFKIGNPYLPQPIETTKRVNPQATQPKSSFENILHEEVTKGLTSLKLSHHAEQRIKNRGINMTSELMNKLESAVEKADLKGSRDALILLDQLAFVVSVKNRTVITAMEQDSMKENVFTNIDSAILM